MANFTQFDLEKQYAIYICGQGMEPPAIYLSKPFAREGEKVVPFLKTKLLTATDDLTIRDIFAEMSRQKTYDVSGDVDLMKVIDESVNKEKDPYWKQLSQQMLNEIKKK